MRKLPLVSIICDTYNHEKYISDALNSFVNQKTSFPFEIIVHDDCSTDTTGQIIRDFQKKYPHLIKPIFEKENQFSKGVNVTRFLTVPHASGKYLAFCEGDDYWIDENKLQNQVNIMESNYSISMCCHANNRIDSKSNLILNTLRANAKNDSFISYEELLSESNFPHWSSMMVKRKDYLLMPSFFLNCPIGDYPLRAYCLSIGEVYYIDKVMSNYRVMSDSSWSKRKRFNLDYRFEMNKKMTSFLFLYDKRTNFAFHSFISKLIEDKDFKSCVFCGRFKEAKKTKKYSKSSLIVRLFVNIGILFPHVATWMIVTRSRLLHGNGR